MKPKSIEVTRDYPTWIIPDNAVWTIPADCNGEIRHEIETYPGPWANVRKVRALALEMMPGEIHTHVYFRTMATARSMPSAVLLGEHTEESAALELGITQDAIQTVSIWPREYPNRAILHGVRSLSNVREDGYNLMGKVSIGGKSRRAFTSSALMRGPDGKLVNVAILYVH